MRELQETFIQQRQFDQFVQTFIQGNQEKPCKKRIEKFIGEIKILEKFCLDKNRFFVLFDHSKFYPTYISSNVAEESGYSIDYILNQGLFFLFQKIHWKQLSLAYKVCVWGNNFQKLMGKQQSPDMYDVCCCGVKFKDRWNKWRTFILKQKMLATTSNNAALLSFIEAEEITSIYKADVVWYRISCQMEGKLITRAYFSKGQKKALPDLLSPREIEILQLAHQRKSNQEIGEQLSISKNTVERHRKNMIARVGVTDMTALIRIAQIVKII